MSIPVLLTNYLAAKATYAEATRLRHRANRTAAAKTHRDSRLPRIEAGGRTPRPATCYNSPASRTKPRKSSSRRSFLFLHACSNSAWAALTSAIISEDVLSDIFLMASLSLNIASVTSSHAA